MMISSGMPSPKPMPRPSFRWLSLPFALGSVEAVALPSRDVAVGVALDVLLEVGEAGLSTVKLVLRQEHVSQSELSAFVIQRWKGSSWDKPSMFSAVQR